MIKNGMKRCPYCKTWKPVSEFYKDKAISDGLDSWCKKYITEYYQKNKIRIRKQQNNYRHTEYGKQQQKRNNEKWIHTNKGRKLHNATVKRYEITEKGQITMQKHIKKRAKMNWIELYSNPFAEVVLVSPHHIDNDHFVWIPVEMHNAYCGYKTEIHIEMLKYIVKQIYGGKIYGKV